MSNYALFWWNRFNRKCKYWLIRKKLHANFQIVWNNDQINLSYFLTRTVLTIIQTRIEKKIRVTKEITGKKEKKMFKEIICYSICIILLNEFFIWRETKQIFSKVCVPLLLSKKSDTAKKNRFNDFIIAARRGAGVRQQRLSFRPFVRRRKIF